MSRTYPDGLTAERNAELRGRAGQVWYRRGLLGLVAVIPVLALFNVFGQEPTSNLAGTAAATLRISAPAALRGGLQYQVRAEVTAHRTLAKPRLVFSRGWWESVGVNSIEPQPAAQSTQDGSVALTFDKLRAGHSLTVWINFTTNPDNAGFRSENVTLSDGSHTVTRIHRSLTIFP